MLVSSNWPEEQRVRRNCFNAASSMLVRAVMQALDVHVGWFQRC